MKNIFPSRKSSMPFVFLALIGIFLFASGFSPVSAASGGTWNGPIYTHHELGFSLQVPSSWFLYEENRLPENILLQVAKSPTDPENYLTFVCGMLDCSPFDDVPASPMEVLPYIQQEFYDSNIGFRLISERSASIQGVPVAIMDNTITVDHITYRQQQYYLLRNNAFIVFTLSCTREENLAELQQIMQTIQFR